MRKLQICSAGINFNTLYRRKKDLLMLYLKVWKDLELKFANFILNYNIVVNQ